MHFEHVAVGGTFDLLHTGHKDFLTGAFNLAKKVTVGLTSDEMTVALGKRTFYLYKERERAVREFLQKSSFDGAWQIIKLSDVLGTTISDATIDAICVTEDTYDGAIKINEARKNLNMKPVEIVKLPLLVASDGKAVSSGRIRAGEISQDGLNYFMHIYSFGNSRLTKGIREELGKPQGQLYPDLRTLMNEGTLDARKLISVGDQITHNLIHKKIFPSLAVVDFKIERKKVFKNLAGLGFSDNQTSVTANNPPGEITRDLISKLHAFFETKNAGRVLVVEGEEDLSVLPATLMSTLGYRIVYGLRNKGIVSIDVDPPTKQRFLDFFDEFEKNI
jgi:pantetheine-phosphate adenylyltransferase